MDKPNGDEVLIYPKDLVKVTKMNHIVEIQHMEKMNRKIHIRKISKERYVDLETGEIKEFELSENRQQNYNSLTKTFKKLRYLINNNFIGASNELHVTLTYKENMKDHKRLYSDFKRFITRLKRYYEKQSTIDYISVVEPQERGAWHCHLLLRVNNLEKVYLENKDVRDLWEQGFVRVNSLKDIDNIGAYLSAYLADVELSEDTLLKAVEEDRQVVSKVVEGKEKKFVKGGRLHMYPPGMNIFRKSEGILYPERQETTYEKAKKIAGSRPPHYRKSYHVENEDFQNTVTFEEYNTKRTN